MYFNKNQPLGYIQAVFLTSVYFFFFLNQLMRIMIWAQFVRAALGNSFRSQIIFSSPLENFRDPRKHKLLYVFSGTQ
jgi:hypothetical protein